VFAVVSLLVRPIAFFISLAGTQLDFRGRMLIAWFGPRGLSSLLLILVPVFAAVPGAQYLFLICCLLVLLSVAIHGGSLMFLKREETTLTSPTDVVTVESEGEATVTAASRTVANDKKQNTLITLPEMREIQQSGAPNIVLDVRAERSFGNSDLRAQGALRIPPDRPVERLKELDVPLQTWLFAFCA
jgi:NhaP-type Na+/H+ and K+/H+ antiporter